MPKQIEKTNTVKALFFSNDMLYLMQVKPIPEALPSYQIAFSRDLSIPPSMDNVVAASQSVYFYFERVAQGANPNTKEWTAFYCLREIRANQKQLSQLD